MARADHDGRLPRHDIVDRGGAGWRTDSRYAPALQVIAGAAAAGCSRVDQAVERGFDRAGSRRRSRAWPLVRRSRPACSGRCPAAPDDRARATAGGRVVGRPRSPARRSTLALVDLAPFPPTAAAARGPRRVATSTDRTCTRRGRCPTRDRTVIDGIPSTTVVRATIDACGHLPRTLATRVVTKGIVKRHFQPEQLVARAEELRNPRRPGAYKVLRDRPRPQSVDRRARATNGRRLARRHAARRFGLPATDLQLPRRPTRTVRVTSTPRGPPIKRGIEYDGYWEHLLEHERFDDDRARQKRAPSRGLDARPRARTGCCARTPRQCSPASAARTLPWSHQICENHRSVGPREPGLAAGELDGELGDGARRRSSRRAVTGSPCLRLTIT